MISSKCKFCNKVFKVHNAEINRNGGKFCSHKCYSKSRKGKPNIKAQKHGMATTNFYRIWKGIKYRCSNPNFPNFKYYGGRGIKVCKRWHKFENFYQDMFPTYKPGLTIDRIDNNGNYEPDNCRWVNCKKQANNRSNNILFTFKGQTLNLQQWSDKAGINYSTLWMRIFVSKWPIEKVLIKKPQ